jgi:ribosomal protein S18 acetylase RimI-like enzyme
VRSWPGEPKTAHLVLADHTTVVSTRTLPEWLARLTDAGFGKVRTGAVSHDAALAFTAHGFRVIQELALLRRVTSRDERFDAPSHLLRPLRTSRALAAAARIDRAAFDPPWHLDENGITEAMGATPQHRIRLAVTASDDPAGYLITGRNGAVGFVQRLAVDPAHEGQGVASSLLRDSLDWLRRRGVTEVLVNTHLDNGRALDLYARHGFVTAGENLVVLERALDGDER